jgi:protein-S-isoprenylcysteine O-methyltransferase Ste14
VLAILGGWLLDRAVPLPAVPGGRSIWLTGLGWAFVAVGVAWLVWALATFFRARTAIYPNRPASVIVEHGPYRYSRNPMYVALAAMTIGIGLVANTLWILLLLPVALFLLVQLVIRREEAYLTAAFPDEYGAYRSRVRRWI